MMRISFIEEYDLSERSIKFVKGTTGLYFIYLREPDVLYPFRRSRLIYIGLSESRQNSVGNRLRDHLSGQSGNLAISNYARRHTVKFTCHSFEVLKTLGTLDLFELESLFLGNFLAEFGSYPICNNQSGTFIHSPQINVDGIEIAWEWFDPAI
jgi:hypothetical protein